MLIPTFNLSVPQFVPLNVPSSSPKDSSCSGKVCQANPSLEDEEGSHVPGDKPVLLTKANISCSPGVQCHPPASPNWGSLLHVCTVTHPEEKSVVAPEALPL